MSSDMDHIFVRAGRPLRIHFDTIHLGAAVGQFNHTVERLGGVVVGLPAESDVLVVDPSEPWVFHDFIKTRRPELRPSVVLGFWIPLCLTTRRLVWITDPCWPKVSVPLEQPTYPEMLPGVFAYTSFVAGVKFSKILSSTDSTPVTSSRQRDPDDTFMSDAGRSVSEVSREIAPGSDSEEDQMLARARKKSKLRSLRFRSTSAGRASPAGADVTLPSADEAEVSGMVPEVDASLPVEDVDMVPVASLPEPSGTEKEAPPPNGRVSPADTADQPATSLQSPKVVAVPSSPRPTVPSVPPAESAPTPALPADTPPAPTSARPATQTPSPRPQVLVIESPTPPPPDTPASSQIAQKDVSASATPVAPKPVSNEHTRAETGPSAPQSSELPVTDTPASSIPSTPAVQENRSAATQDAPLTKPNGPVISESSSAKSTPLASTNAPLGSNVSTKATQPSVPPPTPSSEPAPPKSSAVTPAQKASSKSTVTASAPTATPAPKTPAAAKPSPLSTSSTGLKYRLESSSGRKLTLVHESSTSGGSSENATTPGSAGKPRPRPKMRPVPPPEDDEPERPAPSTSAPTSTTPRPSAPKTKLHIRLGSSSAKAQAKSAGSDDATPSQSTAASSSQQTAPTPSPATTVAATPAALTPATSLATLPTATPASQKTTSSAPTPGSTIKLPKKLKIRSPTHSTVPPRPSPSKAAEEPVFIPSGVTPPPVPPTPTPEQLASKRPPWTKEEDQYIIDYMNWAFAQDRLASTSEIMKEIGANCPYRSVSNWQNRFTAKEDSIYMHSVPVLFERLTNRTSGSGRKDNRSTLEILSGTRTRNRKAADYAGSSSDEERGGIKSQRKRARVSSQGTRR